MLGGVGKVTLCGLGVGVHVSYGDSVGMGMWWRMVDGGELRGGVVCAIR